jgi:hypothetical protein
MCDLLKWRVLVEDDQDSWRKVPGKILTRIFHADFFDIEVASDVPQSIAMVHEAWDTGKPFDLYRVYPQRVANRFSLSTTRDLG